MTDDLSALLAIRAMPSIHDGDPGAPSWLDRVNRDPDMFTSARKVAAWLAAHGGGEAIQPREIVADTGLRLKSIKAAVAALEAAGYVVARPSIRIGAMKLLLRL